MNCSRKRAVFLDRDGTINVEKDYLHRVEDFEFLPGAPESIRRLNQAGYMVIVVTNQSGVARGYFRLEQVEDLHRHVDRLLAACGARVDDYYICPHHPEKGEGVFLQNCLCRKPATGMLEKAASDHRLDLTRSFMIGDKQTDIDAGANAGCRSFLVTTGYGLETLRSLDRKRVDVFPSLSDVVDYILKSE